MMNVKQNDKQVDAFHHEMVDLIKKYQFRDRSQMTCCGVSVSQCYILETLHRFGPLSMNQLSKKMYIEISTVTRVVEELVKKGYATREEDAKDRRIRLITITDAGEVVYQESWKAVFESERQILDSFQEKERDVLIRFLRRLNQAAEEWRSCCS